MFLLDMLQMQSGTVIFYSTALSDSLQMLTRPAYRLNFMIRDER